MNEEKETRFWMFQEDFSLLYKHNREQERTNKPIIRFRSRRVQMPKANLNSDPYEVLIENQCLKQTSLLFEPNPIRLKVYRINLGEGMKKYTAHNW